MKRLISITLSLVMILSLAAGLDFGALAVDEPNGIAFELAGPLYAYKDSDSHDVNGFNAQGDAITYPLYEFSVWDLVKEGNVLKLSYDDGTTVDYTCSSVYQSEGNYYTLKFINDFGETIDTGDLSVRTDQGPDNPWQTGETYDLVLTYKEDLEATVPVHVRENPVESISVEISAPLRLIEGQNCHEEYDEEKDETWFNYTVTTDYLKYSDAVIMVNYSDGRGTVVYLFRDNDWKPYDENGVSVDEDYFRLDFDQWRNHFGPDAENKACVSYYGKTFPVAVDVLDVSEIDEGEVDINGTTRALFAGSEIHTFSITAEETGVYLMEGSLGDKLMGTNEYEFSLFCGEEEVEPLSQEKPIFLFEAGREYTFTVSKISDGSRIEKISFSSVSAVTGMSFTPAGGAIEVYEGDYPDVDNLLYSPGNTLELSFSNGETKTFVCDEEQTFFCSEDEISLWEYCDSIDLAFDADLRCEANYEPWECGRESKLTVTFANASLELSVTVVPSPFASISFTPAKPFEVFEGLSWQRGDFNSEGEWVVYDWYDFSAYDLFKGGNVITVTNYDGSTEDYTYGFYYDEEADRSYDAFISEAGPLPDLIGK